MNGKRQLYAKFFGEEVLLEQGRILYSVLRAFSINGYRTWLFNNLSPDTLGRYGKLIYAIEGLTLTDRPPRDPWAWCYLYDVDDMSANSLRWAKKLQLRYDLFSSSWSSDPIIMPYPMHPLQQRVDQRQLERLRSTKKMIRIFFSGNTEGYQEVRGHYPRRKLSRLEVVGTIIERIRDEVVITDDASYVESLRNTADAKMNILMCSNKGRVDPAKWLGCLAKSDYFLSPPGIVMPMCHNIIEAMAVGTIPITNYPEWFSPPLAHMRNCLVFDDKDSLVEVIGRAINMDQAQILEIRDNVLDYYESQLRSEAFIKKIEAIVDEEVSILVHTENNMKNHCSEMTEDSILFRPGRNNVNW